MNTVVHFFYYKNIYIGPSLQTGVVESGVPVSSNITFSANSPALTTIATNFFTLTDDDTALELQEQYQIMFTGSSIRGKVHLGPPTLVTILDDDSEFKFINALFSGVDCQLLFTIAANVSFTEDQYIVTEGNGSLRVSIKLSTPVARRLIVRIYGGNIYMVIFLSILNV